MVRINRSRQENARAAGSLRVVAWMGLLAILLGLLAEPARAQFQELVSRIPSGANAVVILNMEKALSSPMGVSQGWRENLQKAFDSGMVRVPPQATRFVLAAQIDLEFMEPVWEAAVLDASETISMASIAEKRGGTLDSVANHPAVALANDTYVVQFADKTLGAMAPANRQAVLRWLRELEVRSDAALSPYLRRAATYSDDAGTEIIMAVDLEGALNAQRVQGYLEANPLPEGTNVDQKELAKLLAGVQGVRVGIRIGEKPFGKVVVDFAGDVSLMAPFAKPLLLEVLGNAGAQIDALEEWTFKAEGTEVSAEGYLAADGLRRVLSLIESPAPSEGAGEQAVATVSPEKPAETKAGASLAHFQAVTAMFDDLKKGLRNAKTLSSTQLWFDRYAKRIERLPILNVDEDLLNYSAYVAQQLRNATGAVKAMGIRSSARQAQITSGDVAPYAYGGSRYGRYGWYGGYGGTSAYAVYSPRMEARSIGSQRRVVRSEERAKMATNVQSIRDDLIAATTDIRRKMTQRYQIEF